MCTPKREKPRPKKLEEHEPGATKEEVLATLAHVARTPKPKDGDSKKPEK
jgi:hypothetical protein